MPFGLASDADGDEDQHPGPQGYQGGAHHAPGHAGHHGGHHVAPATMRGHARAGGSSRICASAAFAAAISDDDCHGMSRDEIDDEIDGANGDGHDVGGDRMLPPPPRDMHGMHGHQGHGGLGVGSMGSVGMASSMTSISSIGIGSGAGNVGVSRDVTGSLTLGPPPTMAGGGPGGVGSQGHPSMGTSVFAAGADGGLVGDGAAHVPPHMRHVPHVSHSHRFDATTEYAAEMILFGRRYTLPGSVTGPAGGTAGLAGLAGSGLGGALPSCTGGVGAGAGGGSAASRAAERSCPTAAYEGRVSSTVMAAPPTGHLAQGPVPPYEALINFPRAKSRYVLMPSMPCGGAPGPGAGSLSCVPGGLGCGGCGWLCRRGSPEPGSDCPLSRRNTRSSAIHCVMCGRQPNSTDMTGNAPGMIVIPRQNKDVCRECDKALWRHAESSM